MRELDEAMDNMANDVLVGLKHASKIQVEFVKNALSKKAVKWEDLSYESQREYLKLHPKSKRRLTSKFKDKAEPMSKNDLYKQISELKAQQAEMPHYVPKANQLAIEKRIRELENQMQELES